MKHIMKLLIVGTLFTLLACQSDTGKSKTKSDAKFSNTELKAQQKAWDEVMKIHDAIMPQMGALDKAGVKLEEALKLEKDTNRIASLERTIREVKAADKLMWDWMYALVQLEELRKTKTHKEIMTYLSKELTRIKKVKEKMERSIQHSIEQTKK